MAEWFKAHAWKACKGETLSWVRIPFSPPSRKLYFKPYILHFVTKYKIIKRAIFIKNDIIIFFQKNKKW